MATIISIINTCDGKDVVCLLANGRTHYFHFAILPDSLQSKINELEEELIREIMEN